MVPELRPARDSNTLFNNSDLATAIEDSDYELAGTL